MIFTVYSAISKKYLHFHSLCTQAFHAHYTRWLAAMEKISVFFVLRPPLNPPSIKIGRFKKEKIEEKEIQGGKHKVSTRKIMHSRGSGWFLLLCLFC